MNSGKKKSLKILIVVNSNVKLFICIAEFEVIRVSIHAFEEFFTYLVSKTMRFYRIRICEFVPVNGKLIFGSSPGF